MAGTGTTSYTWTLPGGWTGISTTTSITVVADSSGNISVTANNTCGSSTAQTISVTVNIVNTSVSQSGVTLTANATGATYQWINCNGNTPISGQPNQSFTATNGSYAVIVTQNSCSDTSVCYNITTEGIYFVKNYDGENIHTEKIMIH